MASKPKVLIWPGAESMSALKQALQDRQAVALVLSAGMHNALFTRFEVDAPPESALEVNVQGSAELIGRLKTIAGLEPLGEVERTLREEGWRVTIHSPAPRITLSPP